jgi:hypothetical protein
MANNTSALYTKALLPLTLKRLRARMEGLKYVRNDVSGAVANQNQSVIIPLNLDAGTARDFNGETVAQDLNAKSKTIVINKHKEYTFTLTDAEMLEIQTNMLLNDAVNKAVDAVAKAPVQDFYNLYKEVYNFSGTNASNAYKVDDIIDAEDKLFDKLVDDVTVCSLSSRAYTQLNKELKNAGNYNNEIAGQVLTSGTLPSISNSSLFKDQLLTRMKHTSGTASVQTISTLGVTAAGSTSIQLDGVSIGDTFVKGDLIAINDGSGQQFVVTADVTATSTDEAVAISPAVTTEIATAVSVTMIGDHNVNLMYTRDFAIFIMRSLSQPTAELGLDGVNSLQEVLVDPVSGVSMRFEAHRLPKKKSFEWTFDILYAVETIDPIYACRILTS